MVGVVYRAEGDNEAALKLDPVSVRTVPTPTPSEARV